MPTPDYLPIPVCPPVTRIPAVLRGLNPGQNPKLYLNINFDPIDFLFGACGGLYIAWQNGFITNNLDVKFYRHIYLDHDGLEVAGTWRHWLKWIWDERFKHVEVVSRTVGYAFYGGTIHCFMRVVYSSLFFAEGNLVPMLGTYVYMNWTDNASFLRNWRTLGHLLCYTGFSEFATMAIFRANSSYWVHHFVHKYFMKYFMKMFEVAPAFFVRTISGEDEEED